MASEIYFLLGIATVLVTAGDFFYTTVSFNGAGVIARGISSAIASLFLWVNKKTGSRWLFKFSGMSHILVLVILWIGLLWLGLFSLLMSDPGAVLHASSGSQASAINIFYFSGYIVSTLGNGQYIPSGEGWQIVVAVFSFAGFIFITTAMTYLMNLTTAVIHKRNLSMFISNLGESPEAIVAHCHTGQGFGRLVNRVPQLQQMINKHSQNHYAHPGVHYFYSIPRQESLSINLTNLDEALSIIQHRIKKDDALDQDLRPLRDAINKFLSTIQHHFIKTMEFEIEDKPDLQRLQAKGIPLADEPRNQPDVRDRRKLLVGLLRSTGWSWGDIYSKENRS